MTWTGTIGSGALGEEILGQLRQVAATLQAISDKLGSGGTSSVEIRTSTRGVDIVVKAYAGSDIQPAGDAAIHEYWRVHDEIEQRLMGRAS